jgi:hypothetical protein
MQAWLLETEDDFDRCLDEKDGQRPARSERRLPAGRAIWYNQAPRIPEGGMRPSEASQP